MSVTLNLEDFYQLYNTQKWLQDTIQSDMFPFKLFAQVNLVNIIVWCQLPKPFTVQLTQILKLFSFV